MTIITNLVIESERCIMAVAFSENERKVIKKKLKESARTCLLKYGVKKTTVDQIVIMAGISKGSFYNFYASKEILFFTIIEEYQKSILDDLNDRITEKRDIGTDEFTQLFYELYQDVRRSFIMNIIHNQEFEYLMRRLPAEVIAQHHSLDDMLTKKIFSHLNIRDSIDVDVISASLRAVFMSMVHIQEIGEKDFDEALKFLIRGLALQIIREDS